MRYHGEIGYVETSEVKPGIWEETVTERTYYGAVLENKRKLSNQTDGTASDIDIINSFSIVADAYARDHIFAMRYIKWMGAAWTVTSVDVQRPRLILNVGGLYHGKQKT